MRRLHSPGRLTKGVLITMRSNGRPQLSNVMHHCSEDGVIRCLGYREIGRKYINLAREPWAAMHADPS